MDKHFDIVVAGGGLAGLTAAIGCSLANYSVCVIAPGLDKNAAHPSSDGRTTALLDRSVAYLENLGLWQEAANNACPLSVMRIIDDTKRLFRAAQIDFRSAEIGLEAFGYNLENQALLRILLSRLAKSPDVTLYNSTLVRIDCTTDAVNLTTGDGLEIKAAFLIGAEGRTSPTRRFLGGERTSWSYPQTALVTNFSHRLPHDNISTEFHRKHGPYTTVPLGGNNSSLVWVDEPQAIKAAIAQTANELNRSIERKMYSILGKVEIKRKPQSFPLASMVANRFGGGRVVVIGEAAHQIPPIGAQGFNLGIRDVETIVKLLAAAHQNDWACVGEDFHFQRSNDIHTRVSSIDILNQSLLTGFLPFQVLRSTGLSALKHVGPLRRFMMRQGIGHSTSPRGLI